MERLPSSRLEPWMRPDAHVHVLLGDAPATVPLSDPLHLGPVAMDLAAHVAARRSHWQAFERRLDPRSRRVVHDAGLGALERAIAGDPAIVLWQSQSWCSRLTIAWLAHALRTREVAARRISFVVLPWMRGRMRVTPALWWRLCELGPERPLDARSELQRASVARAFERRTTATGAALSRHAAVWAAFASSEPRRLARLFTEDEDLALLGRAHLAAFPRRTAGPRLRLSTVDRWLLGALDETTSHSYVDVLRAQRQPRPPSSEWGDLEQLVRLLAWSEGPFVEREDDPTGKNRITRHRFRLTARGARLVRRGIDDVAELPPLTTGGHTIGRDPLWVVRGGRLERG